jgi:hypothetical protein
MGEAFKGGASGRFDPVAVHYQDAEKGYREEIQLETKANAVNLLAGSWYDLAWLSAKAGRHDMTLEYLDHAVDSGFGTPRMDRRRS